MARPFPLPSDLGLQRTRPATLLARAGAAHLRAFITGNTPEREAKAMFGDTTVLKAASAPAAISGTSGWAQSLGGVAAYDLIQSTATLSAAAELIDRGLKLNMDGIAEHHVPGRVLNATAAGQWVGEGGAVPVRALSFADAAILRPRKLEVLTTYSRELAEHSNIEEIVRATLSEATGLALDLAMLSTFAGDATRPPGLFAGVAPLTPTAGGGQAAMLGDLTNLFAALAANNAGKTAVIVAALPQAVKLMTSVGPKFTFVIVASTALANGTVAVLEIASFVSGFGSTAEFSVSKAGVVHMEDTTPTDITGGTPSPATPVKSLFQLDLIGLTTTLWAAWGMRAQNHVAWLTGATW
jgi:hypothetical protein